MLGRFGDSRESKLSVEIFFSDVDLSTGVRQSIDPHLLLSSVRDFKQLQITQEGFVRGLGCQKDIPKGSS